jgi:hypothetical protein
MKDYNEIANRVFQRRDEYLEQKRRKKAIYFRRVSIAFSCCIMLLIGVGIWQSDLLKKIEPSPDTNSYISSETTGTTTSTSLSDAVTTTAATTYTDLTSQTTTTTASSVSEHSKTTALSSSGGKNTITTTVKTTSEKNGNSHSSTRTTASGMEIIVTSRSSASHSQTSTRTSGKPVTTSTSMRRTTSTTRHYTTTTTRRHTTTTTRHYTTTTRRHTTTTTRHYTTTTTRRPPAASTTRRFTTTTTSAATTRRFTTTTTRIYTTRVYTSATHVYTSATYVYTSATYVYSYTTYVYTATTAALTNHPWYTSTTATDPPWLTTPVPTYPVYTTVTYNTSVTLPNEFTINDTIYTRGFSESPLYIDDSDELIGSGSFYSESAERTITYKAYKYRDFDPRFICKVKFSNGEITLGINYEFAPENFADMLKAMDFQNSFYFEDVETYKNFAHSDYVNKDVLSELLTTHGNLLDNKPVEAPVDDIDYDDVAAAIYYNLNDVLDIFHYPLYGYIEILNTGLVRFSVDVYYYYIDVGEENVNNIYQKLIE